MSFLSSKHYRKTPLLRLEDVAEVGVLAIRQIVETVRDVDLGAELAVLLVVAVDQIPAQEQDDDDQHAVAAQVDRQRLEVARRVAGEEDLGACGVAGAPREEVHGDADGLLGLPAHVSRQHGHAQTLRGPEGEDDPV